MALLSIRSRLAALVDRGEVPSVAYALVSGESVVTGGFGGAGPETVFQIGSVTKAGKRGALPSRAEPMRMI